MTEAIPFDLPGDDLFGLDNLPYGVFTTEEDPDRCRVGVRFGSHVLDAGAAAEAMGSAHAELLRQPVLNPLMAAGRPTWQAVRADLQNWLSDPQHRETVGGHLIPLTAVTMRLPFEVADYVDFYASEHHATNVGKIFRPDGDALTPNWKHLPIGYHGRAGTVVVSGTPVVRPQGQRKPKDAPMPVFGPSQRLDIEAEVAFVVGRASQTAARVDRADFAEHVFGVCLLNDWSARDLQAWEYVPLGPFLGKSFATSVSAWVTPLEALEQARTEPPARDVQPLPYLDDSGAKDGLDIRITVTLNGERVSEPPFSAMYWTAAQQLAHMTVNGASLRTGDLFASGTVSGPGQDQLGCLLELTAGKGPFLADGDEVTLTAWAPGPNGTRIGLGEVTGKIAPSPAG
ncbi:hypothetical protein N566_21065 [Streptomycetaceae bacterium MP113-05]|nr:hypothetical protein N566_21065 [Streptomycetaceae bacterium MP113-05]